MHTCRSCEEARHFIACVGSSSGGLDLIGAPLVALNINRYNSRDGRSILIHLTLIKARALIGDRLDLKSTVSTRDDPRNFNPPPHIVSRVVKTK